MAVKETAQATRLRVHGGPQALRPAARRVRDDVLARGVAADEAAAVELAVHELLANALEHGHLGDPSVPIDVEVTGADGGEVTVRVSDRALGGRWPARWSAGADGQPGGSTERLRGRGLTLARAAAAGLGVVGGHGRTEVVVQLSTFRPPHGGAG
ncbi:MAG: hypothetical protein EA340_06985 [Nitriliruptor sp.]|nr:MAG: hypothetical protein EA340_06985 [Nitriliruptor sp.]